ncbi:hypothetical protein, partial [Staphylococcus capitis]|uniref:hypothetical protein n=2 Tax=Staphylococcus capitis TaxID=29388 RepID=UPI000CD3995B
ELTLTYCHSVFNVHFSYRQELIIRFIDVKVNKYLKLILFSKNNPQKNDLTVKSGLPGNVLL